MEHIPRCLYLFAHNCSTAPLLWGFNKHVQNTCLYVIVLHLSPLPTLPPLSSVKCCGQQLTCQHHLEQTRILLHAHFVDAPAGEGAKVLVRDWRVPQHVHHRAVLVVAILVNVQVLARIVELPPKAPAEKKKYTI